jgi:anti-anti-sigma factor
MSRAGIAGLSVVPGSAMPGDMPLRVTREGSPLRLVLAGDIDQATAPVLAAALSQALERPGDLHFDLAGIEYCDLAGLRMLIGLGADGDDPQPPHRVVHHLPAHLLKVLEIMGWNTAPGLTIIG